MKTIPFALLALSCSISFAQTKLILVGDVKDAVTSEPLAYATIGVKGRIDQTISNAEGKFELIVPAAAHADTLIVTYVGYEKFEKPIPQLSSFENILLKESATLLDEVRIVHRPFDVHEIDRDVRPIRDNLYAMWSEVTNIEYNAFLAWLEDYNKMDLRKKYDFDLNGYDKSVKEYYQHYHKQLPETKRRDPTNFNRHPAVNISHEAAVAYCKWLTDEYNESAKKKKFKKVVFRLPTLKEWQIAALGFKKFQSWDLNENVIDIFAPKDTMHFLDGKKGKMKVGDSVLYPWYSVYFRHRVFNQYGCYLGNFKIVTDRNCPSRNLAYDGFSMTAPVTCYFPNDMGLFDVVGNVAEMIDEKGKACGGSWNDAPEKSTIHSVKNYDGPDETVGFRVFMEVIEK